MRGAGYDAEEAWILTDHCLDAALCGYEYSGLPKLLNVVDAAEFKRPRRPMAVLRETPATANRLPLRKSVISSSERDKRPSLDRAIIGVGVRA